MSMYSELLFASLRSVAGADRDDDRGRERELLLELAERRRRLGAGPAQIGQPATLEASSGLASQLDYDMVLIRLCRLHGIRFDPADFTRPLVERRRLEGALRDAGVDLQ
jgi:hypothetical protein